MNRNNPAGQRRSPVLASLLAGASLLLAGANPAHAQRERSVTVFHQGVAMTYVPVNRAGPAALGDLRVAKAQLTDRRGAKIGEMHGTLTTTAMDTPRPGDEIRQANLVFQIGREQDQIVVGGQSRYPADSATIGADSSAIRPILGGAGRFAGAHGWARTFHFADGAWKHVFHLRP